MYVVPPVPRAAQRPPKPTKRNMWNHVRGVVAVTPRETPHFHDAAPTPSTTYGGSCLTPPPRPKLTGSCEPYVNTSRQLNPGKNLRHHELRLNGHVSSNGTCMICHGGGTLIPHGRYNWPLRSPKHKMCLLPLRKSFCYPRGTPSWHSWRYIWNILPP